MASRARCVRWESLGLALVPSGTCVGKMNGVRDSQNADSTAASKSLYGIRPIPL